MTPASRNRASPTCAATVGNTSSPFAIQMHRARRTRGQRTAAVSRGAYARHRLKTASGLNAGAPGFEVPAEVVAKLSVETCRTRGRQERAHRSLENRTERGFPQRPHAIFVHALHTKFRTLPPIQNGQVLGPG
jgi:hypothetical protein